MNISSCKNHTHTHTHTPTPKNNTALKQTYTHTHINWKETRTPTKNPTTINDDHENLRLMVGFIVPDHKAGYSWGGNATFYVALGGHPPNNSTNSARRRPKNSSLEIFPGSIRHNDPKFLKVLRNGTARRMSMSSRKMVKMLVV